MSSNNKSEDLYRPVKKDGTHLASSKNTDGAYRGSLLSDDNNQVVGQAEWVKVETNTQCEEVVCNTKSIRDAELTPGQDFVAKIIGEALAVGTLYIMREYVTPSIKSWWSKKAVPKINSTRSVVKDEKNILIDTNQEKPLDTSVENDMMSILLAEINEVHEKYNNDMTKDEYQNEVLDVFILSSILMKKLRKLSGAKIIDSDVSMNELHEENEVILKLSSPDFIGIVNQILINNPKLLIREEKILTELAGYSIIADNRFIPIESSQYHRRLVGM